MHYKQINNHLQSYKENIIMILPSCQPLRVSILITCTSLIIIMLSIISVHSKNYFYNERRYSRIIMSFQHSPLTRKNSKVQNGENDCQNRNNINTNIEQKNTNNNETKKYNPSFEKFITLEKERLNKIIEYEKKRLGRFQNFLDAEKKRLKDLEQQERKSLSHMLLDDVVNDDLGFGGLLKVDDYWDRTDKSSSSTIGQNGWSKLILFPSTENASTTTSNGSSPSPKEEYVYMYEPQSKSPPSMVILFLGGAGIGQFPHITYSKFLSQISNRLNAIIITAPYKISLDHYDLAKETGVKLHRALSQCQQVGRIPSGVPKYFLGHSLGSKLWTISTAAMTDIIEDNLAGIGLISFNNFGFLETTKQVKTFANAMNLKQTKETAKIIDKLLELSEQLVTASGLEFTPSPSTTTKRIIKNNYDLELLQKTRLFVFDDDKLDSSKSFVEAVRDTGHISVSKLPGTHLAPIYMRLSLDDIDFPLEATQFSNVDIGGIKSISYGNEDHLMGLVDAVSDWLLGKESSRDPLRNKAKAAIVKTL